MMVMAMQGKTGKGKGFMGWHADWQWNVADPDIRAVENGEQHKLNVLDSSKLNLSCGIGCPENSTSEPWRTGM